MKKIFGLILFCVGVSLIFDASALRHSDDVKKAVKFVDVFLGSAEELLGKEHEKEGVDELRESLGELRPYIRRLQTYGYILNSADIVDLLDIYERVKRNFAQVENRLRPNTAEECRHILERLDPVIPLMREVYDYNTYPFIRSCNEKDPNVKWMLETYSSDFSDFKTPIQSGNILAYLSEYRNEPIVVELHSGFFSSRSLSDEVLFDGSQPKEGKKNKQPREKNEQLSNCPLKCFILNPEDVVFLVGNLQYEIINKKKSIYTLSWGRTLDNLIESIKLNKCDDTKNINQLLKCMATYFETLLKQLQYEKDPASSFIMPRKNKNPRLVNDPEGENAVKIMCTLIELPREQNHLSTLVGLLQCLLWTVNDSMSLEVVSKNIASLCHINKEESLAALKWANLAFHTEAQCIALRAAQISSPETSMLSPLKSPLISLQNPCTSCFRLPYIFTKSSNGFFYFMFNDTFYDSQPKNFMETIFNAQELTKKQLINLKQKYRDSQSPRLRKWLGLNETAVKELQEYDLGKALDELFPNKDQEAKKNKLKSSKTTILNRGFIKLRTITTAEGCQIDEFAVPGDGNCGYHALNPDFGIKEAAYDSRNILLEELRTALVGDNAETIRKLISQEITDRLVSGDFDKLPDSEVLHPLVGLVQDKTVQKARHNLNTAMLDTLTLQQNIVTAYIDYIQTVAPDITTNWLQIAPSIAGMARTGIADAIAYLRGANLRIVEGRAGYRVGTIMHSYNHPHQVRKTVYLIQATKNHYHKGLLLPLGAAPPPKP